MKTAALVGAVRAAVADAPPAPTPAPVPVPTTDTVAALAARTWERAAPADRAAALLALAWDVRHAPPAALDAVTDALPWGRNDHPMGTQDALDRARLLYRPAMLHTITTGVDAPEWAPSSPHTADARVLADGAAAAEEQGPALGAALILAALAVYAQDHPDGAAS